MSDWILHSLLVMNETHTLISVWMNRTELKLISFCAISYYPFFSINLMNFSCTSRVNYGLFFHPLSILTLKFMFVIFFSSTLNCNFFSLFSKIFLFLLSNTVCRISDVIFDIKQHFPFEFVPFSFIFLFLVSQFLFCIL